MSLPRPTRFVPHVDDPRSLPMYGHPTLHWGQYCGCEPGKLSGKHRNLVARDINCLPRSAE